MRKRQKFFSGGLVAILDLMKSDFEISFAEVEQKNFQFMSSLSLQEKTNITNHHSTTYNQKQKQKQTACSSHAKISKFHCHLQVRCHLSVLHSVRPAQPLPPDLLDCRQLAPYLVRPVQPLPPDLLDRR